MPDSAFTRACWLRLQSKGWLYDIVANGRNGLDVDKFDYLERDSRYTGVKISSDFERIRKSCKAGPHMHVVPKSGSLILACALRRTYS